MTFTIINEITILGAVLGFVLCYILFKRRIHNPLATYSFTIFLFSYSLLILYLGLVDANILQQYAPLLIIPFPAKYLIPIGIYFYAKFNARNIRASRIRAREFMMIIPAIGFSLFSLYWYYQATPRNDHNSIQSAFSHSFLGANEFIYLGLTFVVLYFALKRLEDINTVKAKYSKKIVLTLFFLCVFNLTITMTNLILNDANDSILYNYSYLLVNTMFLYWIAIRGFLNPSFLIQKVHFRTHTNSNITINISETLRLIMKTEEIYKDENLTLQSVANILHIRPEELSSYMRINHNMNFPEYLNKYRVKKMKSLLKSQEFDNYTVLELAEKVGFGSESNFETIFKKQVGLNPSDCRKRRKRLKRYIPV